MSWEAGTTGMDCLSLAIAFHQAPGHFPDLLRGKAVLPARIDVLLHLAGGGALDEGLHKPAFVSADDLRAAARFFIENVLLAREADHYRVLGVNPDASVEQIKEHHRLLMRVFHPDRVRQDGSDAVAARINLAYNALRHPSERAAYDAKRRQEPKASAPPVRQHAFKRVRHERESLKRKLPPVVARHLPQFVLGAVAVVSSLAVALVYLGREPGGAIGGGEGVSASRLDRAVVLAVLDKPAGLTNAPDVEPLLARARAQRDAGPVPAQTNPPKTPDAPLAAPAATRPAQALDLVPQRQATPRLVTEPGAPESVTKAAAPAGRALDPVRTEAPPPLEPIVVAAVPEPRPVPAIAVAPPAAAAPVAARESTPSRPAPAPRTINEDDLSALVARLSDVYERGDLEAFMALFDEGARIERGDKRRIRADYDELFHSTDARQLVIWDMKWAPAGDLFRGEGNYQARVVRRGEDKARVYAGKITLEAVPVNGAPRLRGMFH